MITDDNNSVKFKKLVRYSKVYQYVDIDYHFHLKRITVVVCLFSTVMSS